MGTSKTQVYSFSELHVTGSMVGFVVKVAIDRARRHILQCRDNFEVTRKRGTKGNPDFFTNADKGAQDIIAKVLREAFPQIGIVGEEGLSVLSTLEGPVRFFFTLDPLDGTKAFIRRQSHGVGVMVSLVAVYADGHSEVICAYICDVMSGDMVGFRPGSHKVHMIPDGGKGRVLRISPYRRLKTQYVVLRDPPVKYSPPFQHVIREGKVDGLFKSFEVAGGSIGTMINRLVNGEVGGVMLRPGKQTPWDTAPVLGILRKMGFLILEYDEQKGLFVEGEKWQVPPLTTLRTEKDVLIIHTSRRNELNRWLKQNLI